MNFKFEWIGWMKTSTNDKIWGYFQNDKLYYTFWGRRGKTLNFKQFPAVGYYASEELEKLQYSKTKKGYDKMSEQQMLTIWPHFYDDLEQRLSFCVLANKVK